MKINHSFPIFINKDSKILILGSFPSVKSREFNFYYMHKQNRFYKVLSSIFEEDFYNADIESKKELLRKYHIQTMAAFTCHKENYEIAVCRIISARNVRCIFDKPRIFGIKTG